MKPALPNFIFGRSTALGAASRTAPQPPPGIVATPRPMCDLPPRCHLADCWVYDEFGRIDSGLSASPIPVRHEDLGVIVNVVARDAD